MALNVTAYVTRASLGLSQLNINDHVNYALSDQVLGGTVAWDRRTVSSSWSDGDVTLSRRRPTVMEPLGIRIIGVSQSKMLENMQTLVPAFSQDEYYLKITLNGVMYQYKCEAADYSVEWGYKMHSAESVINFQIPRFPVPTSGGI